ncbi:EAL domain-containing protein [Marichromatium bheemlicum]|uniref:EAL domain-containing protein n=1 Tax=Marichromatium bheemlicum TaxID=365339 RepID=A0ABX1I6K8_9GAMM|nr:EAL domain-containing protein [Marichromatium bheemlicum]NKN32684.1 EAL domain-containing protein [Marichromatium bheemlicum]
MPAVPVPRLSPGGNARQLLVVDDEPRSRASLERLLGARGFCVHSAAGVEEALALLERQHFDLVLLDLILPVGDGVQILDRLVARDAKTAVVVVSATRSVVEATRALRHGACDFVAKPYRLETLLKAITGACERSALRRAQATMQARLRDSERLYRFLVQSSPDLIFLLDGAGRVRFVNQRIIELLQRRPEEVLERPLLELIAADHQGRACTLLETLGGDVAGQVRVIELELVGVATLLPVEIKLLALGAGAEPLAGGEVFAVARDLTAHRRAEEAMRRSFDLLHHVIAASPAVVYARSPGRPVRFSFISDNLRQLLGHEPEQLLSGSISWEGLVHPDDHVGDDDLACDGPQRAANSEYRMRHRDGDWRWIRDSVRLLCDGSGRAVELVGSWLDNTEAHRLAEELRRQASRDALTGLPNRHAFERRLQRAIEEACSEGHEHALCYLDLDQFKLINDTCGHVAGDAVLRQLVHVLSACIRKQDTLARLGGDEFGVLMERCDRAGAIRVAEALCKAVGDFHFIWDDKRFRLGVSIGLVGIDADNAGLDALLSAADSACYAAKDAGRNRIHLYTADDTELARRHGEMQWVSQINLAFEQARFGLAFQPIVPVNGGGAGAHYELLLRMYDAEGATVMPGAFLPAAERYHLIGRLDEWVVETALAWLTEHPGHVEGLELCSINLSGHSLGDTPLLERLGARLRGHQGIAAKLCFEITETAAISNMTNAVEFIASLRTLGCRFALDDFGSGLSSFAYLKNLPVDFLKIDGMFIKDIAVNPITRTMVRSINEVGQAMGMRTVAEFVEGDETLAVLRDLGVDYAQGYGIGRPRPIAELVRSY